MSNNRFENQIIKGINDSIWPGGVYYYPHNLSYEKTKISFYNAWENERDINIYIHIPFCISKCSFCGYLSIGMIQNKDNDMASYIEKYVGALVKEIEYFSSILVNVRIHGIYIGGGTPNVLKVEQVFRIFSAIEKCFSQSLEEINISFEANPSFLEEGYIENLKSIGVSRISIGIQTFDENELKVSNRYSNFQKIYNAVEMCHKFDMKFNIDLMIGLPQQTEKSIWHNIKTAITLEPQSITIYPLTVVSGSPLSQNCNGIMSSKEKYLLLPQIYEFLGRNGYIQESNVSFIRETHYDKNNSFYLKVGSLDPKISTLGLGLGSRSYGSDIHYATQYSSCQNEIISLLETYLGINNNELEYVGFKMSLDENKRRYVMLTLVDGGIDILDYNKRFNSDVLSDFYEEFSALRNLDMILTESDRISLNIKGFTYSDIISTIFVSEDIKRRYLRRKIIDRKKS